MNNQNNQKKKHIIDLNADIGEGFPHDEALLEYISSANIACGAHAGNPDLMRHTLKLCQACDVACGAHPGYPDLANFGRTSLDLSASSIYNQVLTQLASLNILAQKENIVLQHVKAHGALYNDSAQNAEKANAIIDAIIDFNPNLIVFGLAGSLFVDLAKQRRLKVVSEAFADRYYTDEANLVPRTNSQAIIKDPKVAINQVLGIIQDMAVTSLSGSKIELIAHTICIHGDNEHALLFAQQLHNSLTQSNISILNFI